MHSEETPCACPKCGWLGMYRDTDKYVPTDSDFNELEPRYVCPRCTNEIDVQTLGQKGLDALRQEHHLLLKGSYQKDATIEERNERQRYLERFFEHIHQPLKPKNETRKAFEEMMLSGRMNELMTEAVKDGIAATEEARKIWTRSAFFTPARRESDNWPEDGSEFDLPPQFR